MSAVYWYYSQENLSPRITPEFLKAQRDILLFGQFAREHQNTWVEGADAFATAADVDFAMGQGWAEQVEGRPDRVYVKFVDLGAVNDPAVIGLGHAEGELAVIDRLLTFQGSREAPVQLAAVKEAILDLARRFRVTQARVESWQGLAVVQDLQDPDKLGKRVELYSPTVKTNAEEWPILAHRLTERKLVLPPHARLREELLNLVYEVGPAGIRVIDRGRVHQDHAVVVRGICAMLAMPPKPRHALPGVPVFGIGRVSPRLPGGPESAGSGSVNPWSESERRPAERPRWW